MSIVEFKRIENIIAFRIDKIFISTNYDSVKFDLSMKEVLKKKFPQLNET